MAAVKGTRYKIEFLYKKDNCKRAKHSQASRFVIKRVREQCYAGHIVRWRVKK